MTHFKEGDLVKIPFPDGRAVLAKVLYVGKRFENVICISVWQWIEPTATLRNLEVDPIKCPPFYTNILAAKDCGWTVIGNRGLTEAEEMATLRIVGDNVYLKDECLRTATIRDNEQLHEMLGIGMPTVFKWSERVLAGLPVGITYNPEQIP